jgi:hypothetical protein
MTLAEELRAAAAKLRDEHPDLFSREFTGQLCAWLESAAADAERHEAGGWGNDQAEIAGGHPIAVARAIRGEAA